ncbi:YggS family pyridoxal phosphate-dependent enzyme [Actimicrobium sp. CCI2.3]|uniref:YggS family pyridoxal phosphate-dependent enzyme n=1 Tax=Actimicrobium sp. CCI2.3 TaxID=3048616 RepID=UPI002AB3DCB8|nr:YggS family pyridoxal phosphate-dependent enzyme [Actimicrobium sp. CCI2.3]MDY7573744.1 YggS family pyridoxal phosphate-dependent enzyme [Actimicrobium sp. CCI2.3]MEB0020983.1 YggS family pyridoxal phosphate-dependent enzyme [Actimicrobium sp. CCI2.3]
MSVISDNLQAVHAAIAAAALAVSRPPQAVMLLAVSKTFDATVVLDAAAAGQRAFGENYLQEALDKIAAVHLAQPELKLEWHFIGPIQSNKTRPISESFDWVHSVEREKIARRLSDQRPADLPPLNICLQVNISGEASKSGVPASEALVVAQAIAAMPRLCLRGLMAIPEPTTVVAEQRAAFRQLHTLFEQCRAAGLPMDTLSMGMSSDLPSAIAEGATIVRVGSAIFGARTYAH